MLKNLKVLLSVGDYTLLQYNKASWMEWNVAYLYDEDTQTWASGNYCYSIESALAVMAEKLGSNMIKSRDQITTEEKYGLTYDRMSELATLFKDGLIYDDKDSAIEYFNDSCKMKTLEKEYFGIDEEEDEDDE